MSKKTILSVLKKQWILIWLIIVSVALTGVIVYAAYDDDGNTKIKRVVSPSSSKGELFSSNYLGLGSAENNQRSAYVSENDTSFEVSIRNYNQTDPGTTYDGMITYDLAVTLVHSDGRQYNAAEMSDMVENGKYITIIGSGVSVRLGKANDEAGDNAVNISAPINNRNLTKTSGTDIFTVTYNNIGTDSDYYVMFVADPRNSDLQTLSGIIGLALPPAAPSSGWECTFNDSVTAEHNYDKYDGFNYLITGTGNKILKFSYDPSKLEISPSFCGFITEASEGTYSGDAASGRENWKTITINAKPDAEATDPNKTIATRYDIQVYKIVGNDTEWNDSTLKLDGNNPYIEFGQYDYPASS